MKVYFIGAGATAGTLPLGPNGQQRAPVAARLGETLATIQDWQQHFPALATVVQHLDIPIHKVDLETLWACIDYYAKLAPALPSRAAWSGESPELKRLLLRLYGKTCDAAAEALPTSEDYTLGELATNTIKRGDVVVSFNYDTVVERLIHRLRHPIRMACGAFSDGHVHLVKPHGSASWHIARDIRTSDGAGNPLFESLDEADVANREPLLLGAVPIKSELIREVQDAFGTSTVFETVMSQWRAVTTAVRDATAVVAVGYSFPRDDHYGRFLVKEAMRCRRTSLQLIEFYELPERAASTASAIVETFAVDGGVRLAWRGPVTRANG